MLNLRKAIVAMSGFICFLGSLAFDIEKLGRASWVMMGGGLLCMLLLFLLYLRKEHPDDR